MRRASGLAARIEERFGVEVTLVKSSGGVFEVDADGKRIFSKKEAGRFPEEDEVLDDLEDHRDGF